ncbi:MAG: SRPBCC domain-containing protein [Pseudomonadota bacterium]
MSEFTIVKTIFIKAPAEHVWKFLTQKDKLALWFHEGEQSIESTGLYAVVTNSLGKEGDRLCWGEVTEYTPTTRLVHTFTHNSLKGTETTCVWELTNVDGGTILRLTHSGFEQAEDGFNQAANHDVGWDEHFVRLRKVAS